MAKHSLSIAGHRTSITVEDDFWEALNEIAHSEARTVSTIVAEIDAARTPEASLSSAIRVHILRWYRDRDA